MYWTIVNLKTSINLGESDWETVSQFKLTNHNMFSSWKPIFTLKLFLFARGLLNVAGKTLHSHTALPLP